MFFKKESSEQPQKEVVDITPPPLFQDKNKGDFDQQLTINNESKSLKAEVLAQLGDLVVGTAVRLRGSLSIPNKTYISGLIEGNLTTAELIVQTGGEVYGQIDCQKADIAGHIENRLQVHNFLVLRSSAVIIGDIFYKEITIEKGAKITGKLARI